MNLEQIRKKFEHKSYDERMEFINQYDFNDSFGKYYHGFIASNLQKVKNPLYLSELIDLAGFLKFDDNRIHKLILNFLYGNHFLVQLAVFDYLKRVDKFYSDKNSEKRLLDFLKKIKGRHKDYTHFVSCMVFQLLTQLKVAQGMKSDSKKYFDLYISALQEGQNPATVWRGFNDSIDEPYLAPYKKKIHKIVFQMNQQYNFRFKIPPLSGPQANGN